MKNKFTFLLLLFAFVGYNYAQVPVHPTNGSTIVKSTSLPNLTISWTAFGSTTTYDYEYQIDSTGWSGSTNTASTSFTIPYASLSVGNVVTWRVRDNNSGVPGLFTNYSFTIGPDPTPTPANNSYNISVSTANVSWTAFDEGGWGNGNYDAEFGTDPTFVAAPLASVSGTSSTSLSLPALSNNTTYYWRVRDTDIDGGGTDGGWFTFQFTTQYSAPVISSPLSPVNGSYNNALTDTLDWSDITGATDYYLQVSTDPTFTSVPAFIFNSLIGSATSQQPITGLVNNTTYYWRVYAYNSGTTNTSPYSTTYNFTTVIAKPVTVTPALHAWGVSLTPTLTWTEAGNTSNINYYVDYSTNNTFAGATTVGPLAVTNTTLPTLLNNKLYYWRVRAVVTSGSNNPDTSATTHFITLLGTAQLTAPADSSVNNPINITFKWNQPADTNYTNYYIDYDTTGTFASPTTLGPVSDPLDSLVSTLPFYFQKYFWRVRSVASGPNPPRHNSGLETTTSATFNFWTKLAPPSLVSVSPPTQGNYAAGVSIVPTFTWNTVKGAQTYELILATNSLFSSVVRDTILTGTTFTLPNSLALTNGATYYWRVRAIRSTGVGSPSTSDWSSTWQFITVAPAQPYLVNPTNLSIISSGDIYFTWYTGVYGIQYRLQVTTYGDASFSSPFIDVTTTNFIYTVNILSDSAFVQGGAYLWRVIAETTSPTPAIINFSSTWQFSLPGLPQPVASYPTGNVSIYSNPPTLYWYLLVYNPQVTQYIVRYRRSDQSYQSYPTGSSNLYGTFTTSSTNLFVTIPYALDAGYQYYWEVAAWDGTTSPGSLTNWSSEASFTVYANISLLVCYPSFPVGGGPIYINPPTLYWYTNVYSPGLYFAIQYSQDNTFTTGVTTVYSSSNYYTLTSSLGVGHWYWRVAASFTVTSYPSPSYGPWSAYGDFDVTATSYGSSVAVVPILSYPVG